jgi:multidrug efflux pump
MTIGTMFTLFVLPAFYLYLARDQQAERARKVAIDGGEPQPQHG